MPDSQFNGNAKLKPDPTTIPRYNAQGTFMEKYGIYMGFIIILVLFSFLSPFFFTQRNLLNIIVQSSIIAIIAIGETIVILTGGIDLSVGSIVAFISVLTGLMLVGGVPIYLAVIIGLLVGLLIGFLNGLIIAFGRVPAFIMTLGMMSIAKGSSLAINDGMPVAGLPFSFEKIATAEIFGLPIFLFYCIITFGIMFVVLNKTRLGRYIFAIGGNRSSARLSGVKVKKIETITYMFSGLFAAVGGILLTARLNYATPLSGSGYELDAIAATVIGGTALSGGKGNIMGTLIGALILGTLKNGLTLLNVSSFFQQIIIGIVIIATVYVDKMKEKRSVA